MKDVLLGGKGHLVKEHGVVEYGFYARDVQHYLDLFGRENVHLMIFEDVNKNRGLALKGVFRFLGVDPDAEIAGKAEKVNAPSANRFLLTMKYYLPFLTKFGALKLLRPLFKGSTSLKQKDNALVEALLPKYENDIRTLMELLDRKELWGVKTQD